MARIPPSGRCEGGFRRLGDEGQLTPPVYRKRPDRLPPILAVRCSFEPSVRKAHFRAVTPIAAMPTATTCCPSNPRSASKSSAPPARSFPKAWSRSEPPVCRRGSHKPKPKQRQSAGPDARPKTSIRQPPWGSFGAYHYPRATLIGAETVEQNCKVNVFFARCRPTQSPPFLTPIRLPTSDIHSAVRDRPASSLKRRDLGHFFRSAATCRTAAIVGS